MDLSDIKKKSNLLDQESFRDWERQQNIILNLTDSYCALKNVSRETVTNLHIDHKLFVIKESINNRAS